MLMVQKLSAEKDIKWGSDTVTVQDYGLVRVLGPAPDGKTLHLRRQDGVEFEMIVSEFNALYGGTIREQVFKPLHNPVEAWVAEEETVIDIGGDLVEFSSGDALIRNAGGSFVIMPADQYSLRYKAYIA